MKQYLLVSFLSIAFTAPAWNVSDEPTRRSALIEEFTGIHCPNCPDGHRVAARLNALHPDDVYVVSVHAGYYAQPYPTEPDFRTETGEAVHDQFGINSYPCAVISRSDFGSGFVTGRSSWGSACREATRDMSPVNLWSACSYDPAGRMLHVDVEGFLTEDMTDPRLSVWLLQSEIAGPQSGGGLGVEYPHRHMLRASLTEGAFGEAVDVKASGEYFSRSVDYALPESINGIAVDPVNIELLCFVSEGEGGSVYKVSACRPATAELEQPFVVSFSAPDLVISKNYAFDYLEVYIENHGGVEVNSAEFNVTLNGKLTPVEWTGAVAPHSSALVRLPLDGAWAEAIDNDANKYTVRMMNANGKDVETASISGQFNEIFEYPAEMSVKIKTDVDAADNSWRILDSKGEVVKEFGPYPDGESAEYTESVSLEPGAIYALEIFDRWGDGVRHPSGYMKLYDMDGKSVAQLREINGYGVRQFFRTATEAGVADAMAERTVIAEEYIDLGGRSVAAPGPGIYLLRSTYSDGKTEYSKKIISK
ncbi:MAG: Omp28-related outer membrane protein [Muribaculaceae bacterium]|nr:Omp28-related outer membrane protein [Muribaculaceae bacterium]